MAYRVEGLHCEAWVGMERMFGWDFWWFGESIAWWMEVGDVQKGHLKADRWRSAGLFMLWNVAWPLSQEIIWSSWSTVDLFTTRVSIPRIVSALAYCCIYALSMGIRRRYASERVVWSIWSRETVLSHVPHPNISTNELCTTWGPHWPLTLLCAEKGCAMAPFLNMVSYTCRRRTLC